VAKKRKRNLIPPDEKIYIGKIVICNYCKDRIEVGGMTGEFNCPTCGTKLKSR